MIELAGYKSKEIMSQGLRTTILSAVRQKDKRPVVLKVPNNEHPTAQEIARLQHEYDIAAALQHQGVVKPLGLEKYQNGYALVLEDFGGDSLAKLIEKQGRLEIKQSLEIARSLSSSLEAIHCNNIIKCNHYLNFNV